MPGSHLGRSLNNEAESFTTTQQFHRQAYTRENRNTFVRKRVPSCSQQHEAHGQEAEVPVSAR